MATTTHPARLLATLGAVALVVLGSSIVFGAILGVPMGVGYVESGSMEPTMATGDGFVAIPAVATSEVSEGDVVVFEAEQIDGGELTTHRVVDETDRGYVTRGDANPVTDQDGDEPPVSDQQIVAKAVQLNGDVVTIPHVGTAAETIDSGLTATQRTMSSLLGVDRVPGPAGVGMAALGLGVCSLVASLLVGEGRSRGRERTREDVLNAGRVVLAVALVLSLVTVGTTITMAGGTEIGIVSATFDGDRADIVEAGETEQQPYKLKNGGLVPLVSVIEPDHDGVTVAEDSHRLSAGGSATTDLELTAPDETGYYEYSLSEVRYVAVLPASVLAALHATHPALALIATTAVIVGAVTLPFALLLGVGSMTTRRRERSDGRGRSLW